MQKTRSLIAEIDFREVANGARPEYHGNSKFGGAVCINLRSGGWSEHVQRHYASWRTSLWSGVKIASQKGWFRFAIDAHTNIQNSVGGGHQHAKAFALGIPIRIQRIWHRAKIPRMQSEVFSCAGGKLQMQTSRMQHDHSNRWLLTSVKDLKS